MCRLTVAGVLEIAQSVGRLEGLWHRSEKRGQSLLDRDTEDCQTANGQSALALDGC